MKSKGSITVFLSFVLVFVTGLFFTFSEVLRFYCLKGQSARSAALACESTLSEYCRPLWEDYGILAVDGGYGEEQFRKDLYERKLSQYMELNGTSEGVHFFQAYTREAALSSYTLLTDGRASGLIREAAIMTKDSIPETALKEAAGLADRTAAAGDSPDISELLGSGRKAMDAAKKKRAKSGEEAPLPEGLQDLPTVAGKEPDEATKKRLEDAGDPVKTVSAVDADGILGLVLPRGSKVSGEYFQSASRPGTRSLSRGNGAVMKANAGDTLLFRFWMLNDLQNYTKSLGHKGLQYEAEYIVCGASSDRENLKGTVNRILALREASNLASLVRDPVKVGQAEALAIVLAGPTANPAIIAAIKAAIIASWSYCESVMDLRRLLAGGKVAVVKTPADWTSQLYQIASILSGEQMARESAAGMSYGGFLFSLLLLTDRDKSALRACDIMEEAVHRVRGYGNVRMDNMLVAVNTSEIYQADPLFLSFVLIFTGEAGAYDFPYTESMSYLGG